MALIATLTLNSAGQCTGYHGHPGSIDLVQTTHTVGSGNYNVQFATRKFIRTSVPAVANVTLVDSSGSALACKLQGPIVFTPYPTPVKFIYNVQFNIIVYATQCLILGLCTTVPMDPNNSILITVLADEYTADGSLSHNHSNSAIK